jgi:hypothetical protein
MTASPPRWHIKMIRHAPWRILAVRHRRNRSSRCRIEPAVRAVDDAASAEPCDDLVARSHEFRVGFMVDA